MQARQPAALGNGTGRKHFHKDSPLIVSRTVDKTDDRSQTVHYRKPPGRDVHHKGKERKYKHPTDHMQTYIKSRATM